MNIILLLTVLISPPPLSSVTRFTIDTSPTVPQRLQPTIHPHSACYQGLMGENKV